MADLIRWTGNDRGGYLGYAGTLPDWFCQIWRPDLSDDEWILQRAAMAGRVGKVCRGGGPDELKARAEELLREFASSVGAVFPADLGEQAVTAAAGAIFEVTRRETDPGHAEATANLHARLALRAAELLIRAEADSRRIPGSEMYMAGAAAERERIWSLPVTQRFEVDDCILTCAGCGARLTEGRITHQPKCSEMRLADLIGDDQ